MRFLRTLCLLPLTVLAILLTSLAHADFTDGVAPYVRGDYEEALKIFRPLIALSLIMLLRLINNGFE